MRISSDIQEFQQTGRIWRRDALPEQVLAKFDKLCDLQGRPGERLGQTGLVDAALADPTLLSATGEFLDQAKPVRVVAFNKTTTSNWQVPWHQDRVIAVKEKHDVPGFKNWSSKAGIWHCEPPVSVLNEMLFVRVHLDDCDAENGAMEIALNSHLHNVVASDQARAIAEGCDVEICQAKRGDVLILNMLTLHRSGSSRQAKPRRTLRIDYAVDDLPSPLEWA